MHSQPVQACILFTFQQVVVLGKDAFEKCINLHDVYAYDVTPAIIDANMFTDIVFINEARLIVPVKSGHLLC